MSRFFTLFAVFLFQLTLIVGQQNEPLFTQGRSFTYQVVFIKSTGDTLTNENMTFTGVDDKWKYQKSQSVLVISYFPDTTRLKYFEHPLEGERKRIAKNLEKRYKGKRGWENYTWIDKEEVTGKVVDENFLFLHPPRSNQYVYHWMSAYPEIHFDKLKIGETWESKVEILGGYPSMKEFVGTRIDQFHVKEKLSYNFNGKILNDCWRIAITSNHSVQRTVYAEYIFSKTHGFLQMNHEFFDGVKINYKLKEITSVLSKDL